MISLLLLLSSVHADGDPDFPTPELLKPNVAFWKKIYTEVSLTEGLLHDRDFPAVVYRKVAVGKRRGRSRSRYLKSFREEVAELIETAIRQPETQWSRDVAEVGNLLKQHVPEDQWSGAPDRIRFQQGQKERFAEGVIRSGAYLDTIQTVLREYGVPLRIAFLPHVESSFNPYAYSKVGAAGLWQFMRGTGKRFMEINYLVDERRDPFLSTIAAAKLLKHNYEHLGTWPLAITAYNHGLYGMKRAVRSTGSKEIGVIIEKHRSRSFRFASKNFYGCFLAASEIAGDLSSYLPEVKLAPRLQITEIKLGHYVRPSVIAEYLNVDMDVLKALNPALRPVVYTDDKLVPAGYGLRLPGEVTRERGTFALASIPDTLLFEEPERQQYYRVRRGDNLYGIASRLGVSAYAIAAENDIDRIHRIYAGQVLRVPGSKVSVAKKKKPEPEVVAQADIGQEEVKEQAEAVVAGGEPGSDNEPEARLASLPSPPAARPDLPAVPKPEESQAAGKPEAQRVAGEEISEERESEPVEDEMTEVLAMPALVRPQTSRDNSRMAAFDVEVYDLDVTLTGTGNAAEIRVSVDETMGHYAEWLDIPTQRIRNLNRMGRGSAIRIGQRLLIPVKEDALDRFVETRLEYHMALEEDFYAQFKVTDTKPRVLRRGENLWDICNGEEQVPLWLFKKHNKQLNLASLVAGTEILIPQVEEKTEEEILAENSAAETPPTYPHHHRESLHPRHVPRRLVP